MTTWRIEQHKIHTDLVNELNSFKGYKWELLCKNECEYHEVNLLNSIADIWVRPKNWQGKQYTFVLDYKNLPYISYYAVDHVKKDLKEPNGVGVLNEKKIREWVDYLVEVYRRLVILSNERVEKVEEFKDKVMKLNPTITSEYGNYRGYVKRNGLEYSFEIDRDSGYISEKIEIPYDTNKSIESFLELSNNAYKA